MVGRTPDGAEVVDDDPTLVLGDEVHAPSPVRPRRGRRILVALGIVVLLLVALTAGTVYVVSENLGNNVARVPNVFGPLDVAPRPVDAPALTFLLVGTDSRADAPTTGTDAAPGVDAGSQRSDVLMLAQVAPDRKSAAVVSIPRDSWVDIPGHGKNKINAAYAFGGPSLLIQTVEQLTAVHVDHFAVIDFAGFQAMVDTVGGIDVQVAKATSNFGVSFQQGLNHLDGAEALAYVRQRYDLPRGDLDRAARQQNALRALLDKAVSSGVMTDPIQLYRLLDAVSRSVSVDDTLSNGNIREIGLQMRELRASNLTLIGAPVSGLGREGKQSVTYLDSERSSGLWAALRSNSVAAYATANIADLLREIPP